jgi:hypothetical protein
MLGLLYVTTPIGREPSVTSTIARAHSLAAQITAATGATAEVGQDTDGVTVSVELPATVSASNWDAMLLALTNLPARDRMGGERLASGVVRLWALLRDDLPQESIP